MIFPTTPPIDKYRRQQLGSHRSFVVWLTGLSGSGKSTLSQLLEQKLHQESYRTYILDGDNIRQGLNKDLSFSVEDRRENIRRTAEVAKLMVDAGIIVIAAFITPFQEDRALIKSLFQDYEFFEVFVKCPLEVCEQRDVKGLYQKARLGLIGNFTGISSPFQIPKNPDLIADTHLLSPNETMENIYSFLKPHLSLERPYRMTENKKAEIIKL